MAKNCAVCGEPFSWKDKGNEFDFYALGVKPEHNKVMCPTCFNLLYAIHNGEATESELQKAEQYLQQRGDADLNKNYELLLARRDELGAKALQQKAEEEKKDRLLITSGSNFEGCRITKYIDYVVYETTVGMELYKGKVASFAAFLGSASDELQSKLVTARKSAIAGLKVAVQEKGANAIIGINIDYEMFGDAIIGVIATGTAVVIEKT